MIPRTDQSDRPSLSTANRPWLAWVAVVSIAGAALITYRNSWNVPFLLDDVSAITENPSIRQLGVAVWSPPASATTGGRPLLNLSFALNYVWGGTAASGYHAMNLLIHVLAGLTLFGVVRRTLLSPGVAATFRAAAGEIALIVALLWTLHPLQTESVTYLSQRAESLMGLFYLLTLYCAVRSMPAAASKGWSVASIAFCLAGMATKEVMVTAPILVILYDRSFFSATFREAWRKRRWLYGGLGATWLLLGFLMRSSHLDTWSDGYGQSMNGWTYALTETRVVATYLKLAVWPYPLVFDYGSEVAVMSPWQAVPYALALATVLAATLIVWRRKPGWGFLGASFFLILAPTSSVIPIAQQPMAESRMYLPLAAVIALATIVVFAVGGRKALVGFCLIAVVFGALTIFRNHDYRSEVSIWADTIAKVPTTSRGFNNLGLALAKEPGNLAEAISLYETALRIDPNNVEAHFNLGNAFSEAPVRRPEAIAQYEAVLHLRPDYAEAHNNLGLALAREPGSLAQAILHFEAATRLKPSDAENHSNLAGALMGVPERRPEAVAHYETALSLNPQKAELHFNLANALMQMSGRMSEAVVHYETALRLKPDYQEAHNNLAAVLLRRGQLDDAIAHMQAALDLHPENSAIRANLKKLQALRQSGQR